LDPPYGWNIADWDREKWRSDSYLSVLNQVISINISASWVAAVFLDIYRVNDIMASLSKTFDTFELFHWVKSGTFNNRPDGRLKNSVEYILLCFRHPGNLSCPRSMYHFQRGEQKINSLCTSRHTIFRYNNRVVNTSQKSTDLLCHLINKFCPIDAWVLDLCAGSGSTAHAALTCARSCVSIELDHFQYRFILNRLENLANFQDVKDEAEDDDDKESEGEGGSTVPPVLQPFNEVLEVFSQEASITTTTTPLNAATTSTSATTTTTTPLNATPASTTASGTTTTTTNTTTPLVSAVTTTTTTTVSTAAGSSSTPSSK
jgi:hypothetical protein